MGIDTAYDYFDQADIRAVLAAKKVKRSDIFITTKVRVLSCTSLLRCVSCHICTGTGLSPATFTPEHGAPMPQAAMGLGCYGTGLATPTSVPQLGFQPWPAAAYICAWIRLPPATLQWGLGACGIRQ